MADYEDQARDSLSEAAAAGPLPANDDADVAAPDHEDIAAQADEGVIPRDTTYSEDNAEAGDFDDPDETANSLNQRS